MVGEVFTETVKHYRYSEQMKPVRFQALTAASMKKTAFWDTAPCSLTQLDRRFRCAECLQHQGDRRGAGTVQVLYSGDTKFVTRPDYRKSRGL
jgi:hypothetical protein